MSELLDKLISFIGRQLRGPAFSTLLRRLDVDPKRYWLLMDLFHKLSTRQEMTGQLGRETKALRMSAAICFIVSAFAAVLTAVFQAPVWAVIGVMLGITALTLVATLLSETANSLVNPDEGLALAHQPINGATYTAAKLSHLFNIVLHYVLGWNLLPALLSPFMKDGRWFSPILYLPTAFALGIFIGLFCCGIFGWLIRLVPARRMKSAAQFVQALPFVIFGFIQFSPRGTARRVLAWMADQVKPIAALPPWILVLVAIAAVVLATIFGLRSLSGDYLIRVSSMVHGRADAGTRVRWSLLGAIVRRMFGGQASRAGFDYMRRMMLRDWQFRRQLLEALPMTFFMVVGVFASANVSPFSRTFATAHAVPHLLGFILYMTCLMLPYGTDFKGVWLFLVVSDRRLSRFARGVHASLWLTFVIVPNVVLFPLFAWFWGAWDSAMFLAYSIAATTVYLGVGVGAIDGVPFGKQVSPGRTSGMRGGARIFIFSLSALAAVGIQYLLFRSRVAVWLAIVIVGATALLVTRRSLRSFESAIRYHLGIASGTSTMIYTEVGTDSSELKLS